MPQLTINLLNAAGKHAQMIHLYIRVDEIAAGDFKVNRSVAKQKITRTLTCCFLCFTER